MIGRTGTLRLNLLLTALLFTALWGCGGSDGDLGTGTDALGMLEPSIQDLDARLQSHYDTVSGILNAGETATAVVSGGLEVAAAAQAAALTDQDRQALRMETQDYQQDMHRILDDLGDTVTAVGSCQMTMGGMMFGSPEADETCPCQPYMDTSSEEVEQHVQEMLRLMDQGDESGLWQEMETHRNQMRSHIQEMATHMRQTYGSQSGGGMMGGQPGGPGSMM